MGGESLPSPGFAVKQNCFKFMFYTICCSVLTLHLRWGGAGPGPLLGFSNLKAKVLPSARVAVYIVGTACKVPRKSTESATK